MKAKKRPTQDGYYLYAIKEDADVMLMYYANGRYALFAKDINNDKLSCDIKNLTESKYGVEWLFWGPVNVGSVA